MQFLVKEKNLSVETILNTDKALLSQWISKVHFHNKKADYIKRSTQIIQDKHEGKVPDNMKDLVALPGVGPNLANYILQRAFKKNDGVHVDAHVHRIS